MIGFLVFWVFLRLSYRNSCPKVLVGFWFDGREHVGTVYVGRWIGRERIRCHNVSWLALLQAW